MSFDWRPRAGFAELVVSVNSAPYGGYVDATPRVGTAAQDVFLLESLGWTDDVDDLPLVTSFHYANGGVSSLGPSKCVVWCGTHKIPLLAKRVVVYLRQGNYGETASHSFEYCDRYNTARSALQARTGVAYRYL